MADPTRARLVSLGPTAPRVTEHSYSMWTEAKTMRIFQGRRVPAFIFVWAALAVGCGGGADENKGGGEAAEGGDSDGAADSGAADTIGDASEDGSGSDGDISNGGNADAVDVSTTLSTDTDYWVLYSLRGRIPGQNEGITDYFLMSQEGGNPLDPSLVEPLSMTEFSLTGQQFQWCPQSPSEEIGCTNGCFLDEKLKWLAVQLPLPTPDQLDPSSEEYEPSFDCLESQFPDPPDVTKGVSVQLGQFTGLLKAKLIKDAILTNIVHLQFAGNYLYYSKLAQCTGPACQFDIYRANLAGAFQKEKLFTFPPDTHLNLNLWNTQYKGHFHVSEDGEFLALQNPFFGAQQQWVWANGNIQLLQQNCDDGDVQCKSTGTGAEHTDRDPLAVAPDYQNIVTITNQGSRLRAWSYPVYEDEDGKWAVLMSVQEGESYQTQACNNLLEDWQYVSVEQIQYAPEGESVLYLGRSECGSVNSKARTDLLELNTDVLCSCTSIGDEDIRNITNNPEDSTASNIVFYSFDICPGGEVIAAVGTPKYDQSGNIIGDQSTAHRNDKELYLLSRDGGVIKQITREVSWEVQSVRCIEPLTFAAPK